MKKQKGITLIALVVTIVVLIILATVSINAVVGENGLIRKAQEAKELYDNSTIAEEYAMNTLAEQYDNATNNNTTNETPKDPTANWDLTKVQKVTSEDNIVVPVPIGYTASTVTGEKSVATGFVIKQGNDGSKTSGINEFVWVPVPNISDLYDSANNAGQLWEFSGTTSTKRTYPTTPNSGYREPDVVIKNYTGNSGCDASSSYLQQAGLSSTATAADFKTQLQNEFITMKNSVEKYGGFYIGRYETGNLSQTTAVVQKNNTDINNQTWYTQYRLSKTIKANNNVISSMIWGCQWDATLRWMQTSSDSTVVNYVTNSTGKGNYAGTQGSTNKTIPTGSNPNYAVNNIYDMAGNVLEWTLEAASTYSRVFRGGNCGSDDSNIAANNRDFADPINSWMRRLACHTLCSTVG